MKKSDKFFAVLNFLYTGFMGVLMLLLFAGGVIFICNEWDALHIFAGLVVFAVTWGFLMREIENSPMRQKAKAYDELNKKAE